MAGSCNSEPGEATAAVAAGKSGYAGTATVEAEQPCESTAALPALSEADLLQSVDDGGLLSLAQAAVPAEVREALTNRLVDPSDPGSASQQLAALLRALASPPGSVSLRLTCAAETQVHKVDARLTQLLQDAGHSESGFQVRRAPDWLNCPEARIIVPAKTDLLRPVSVPEESSSSSSCSSSRFAEFVIDAACAMAVLRGADVFCMGVMAATPRAIAGQAVRLWVVPEGKRVPNRGSIISGPPQDWPAVLAAAGFTTKSRGEIFATGAKGTAVQVQWRRSAEHQAPLVPMNGLLEDSQLHGQAMLQQLPSCVCARVLGPKPGDKVLDMCSAPGGKTSHLAQLLGCRGRGLVAVDRSLARVRRVEALCALHGLDEVRCIAADSRHLCDTTTTCNNGIVGDRTAAKPGEGSLPEAQERDNEEEEPQQAAEGQPGEEDSSPWPVEAEEAFSAAVATHGAGRFRSSKRIWKAVVAACGRSAVTRMQVNARLRQLGGKSSDGLLVNNLQGQEGPPFPPGSFDRILLDPPCSAMGQRPLLRWGKSLADVRDHADYQQHFLRTAAKLLRPGGELVYSTCTLTPEENEDNVRWALSELPLELLNALEGSIGQGLEGLPGCGLDDQQRQKLLRFDPRSWDAGFFIARFRRLDGVAEQASS